MKHLGKQSLRRALGMLTIEQAAVELAVTPRMINNEIQSGRLTCDRLGNSGNVIRIIRYELEHFARRNPWNVRMMRVIAIHRTNGILCQSRFAEGVQQKGSRRIEL